MDWEWASLILALAIVGVLWWVLARTFDRQAVALPRRFIDWPEANSRAEALLKDLIGEEEYRALSRQGFIEVQSPSLPRRTYRVPKYRAPVTVFENGKPVMRLCVQPKEPVPEADVVVMHKLMIEANEPEYLKVARQLKICPRR